MYVTHIFLMIDHTKFNISLNNNKFTFTSIAKYVYLFFLMSVMLNIYHLDLVKT